jgi:membrane-associated protease RseP (regulator of RpoE activity)
LFDIGISGPLAGLAPTLLFCVLGLYWPKPDMSGLVLGKPLLFTWLTNLIYGPIPFGFEMVGPLARAGLVGLFITALNLFPIGQLDGGHVLYALLRRKAHVVATILLTAAAVMVVWHIDQLGGWMLMIFLLAMMGPRHPPTANDDVPLGTGRIILGWLTLAFLLIGFTPTPIIIP